MIRSLAAVWAFVVLVVELVAADPCRTNFGGCDAVNGLCWGKQVESAICTCKAGYKDSGLALHFCIDVDECQEDPALCSDNAVCENTDGSYKCTCKCGYVMDYTGQKCLDASKIEGMCQVPKFCKHYYDDNAGPVGFRIRDDDDYVPDYTELRTFAKKRAPKSDIATCKCADGFELNNCRYCVDIDECSIGNPCPGFQSTCTNTEGSYYCGCIPGYTLGPCGRRCYLPTQDIPRVCEDQEMNEFTFDRFSFRTFVRPKRIIYWQSCGSDAESGDAVKMGIATIRPKEPDLFLTWTCDQFGQSTLEVVSEEKAEWGPWSCWTACKATCWGGLQTRERKCLNGLPSRGRCRGAGTERRKCYHGPSCAYRIRKDAESLTKSEQDDLVQAMEQYKKDMSVKGFFHTAGSHAWPYQCDKEMCCLHGAKIHFMAWHRSMILSYEEGINRYMNNKSLGLPYWNWLRVSNMDPPNLVWDEMYDGRPNPFAGMKVRIDQDVPGEIQRSSSVNTRTLSRAESTWGDAAIKNFRPYSMHEFASALESAHGSPHVAVCPGCRISMSGFTYAGFDPIFMFHHTQIDRLWAVQQYEMESAGNTTWTVQTALEPLEREGKFGERYMPFGNKTISAFPVVQVFNTLRDTFFYEELTGVKYDDLERNGYPDVVSRARPPGEERLFIAQYLKAVKENVYINYYQNSRNLPCSSLSSPIARTELLGTSRNFENSVPRLTTANVGWLASEFPVSACYTTSSNCRDRCPEVDDPAVKSMPDPFLVYYVPNQAIDVFKYRWESGMKFPTWRVTVHSKWQWILFYGDRSGDILQVRSRDEYDRCDVSKARKFPCNSDVCLLKSGIYYLVDRDSDICEKGVKMIIVSAQ